GGEWCRHPWPPDQPGQRDFSRLGRVPRRHRVEGSQNAEAPRIEIGAHALAARAFVEIRRAAVLAAQEPLGEAEIGDDADLLLAAELGECPLEAAAVVEIM